MLRRGKIDIAAVRADADGRAPLIAMPLPDIQAVDDLCQLVLTAQRLGCTVQLAGASDELREVLDLAGVTGLLLEDQPDLDLIETDLG